ncbi:alpha-2,8-sialyltransferase 8F-like, partial [Anneissia japonica]|uniref:alpha-2,8-sialyltransferase 8F-like n=1 Tax=Anneissia japonica TaxID=1529436 RepID=UPI0014256D83
WKVQPLAPCKCKGVLEKNDLFPLQIQAHQELAKLINSSKEQNRKHKETKYIMGISEEEQNIKDIADTLQIPWKLNISNVYKLRNEIAKSVHTEMILNQNDVRLSETIRYMNQNKTVTISKKFYNMLPKISPIKGNNKRCAIVGNGGILSGSKCGNEIDMADFVIRCNAPPINHFPEDAGLKSNITTFNPTILTLRYVLCRLSLTSLLRNIIRREENILQFYSIVITTGAAMSIAIYDNNAIPVSLKILSAKNDVCGLKFRVTPTHKKYDCRTYRKCVNFTHFLYVLQSYFLRMSLFVSIACLVK